MKGYRVKSNRESGKGRGDIFIMPIIKRNAAAILELKVAGSIDGMKDACFSALKQIEDKNYEQEMRQLGYSSILKYGIAFFGKDCLVRI